MQENLKKHIIQDEQPKPRLHTLIQIKLNRFKLRLHTSA